VFVIERIQRIIEYSLMFFIEEKTSLVWLMFGTGLLFDVIDSYFRMKSIRAAQEAEQFRTLEVSMFDDEAQRSSNRDTSMFPLPVPLVDSSNNPSAAER
jgi:hypothetical protein